MIQIESRSWFILFKFDELLSMSLRRVRPATGQQSYQGEE